MSLSKIAPARLWFMAVLLVAFAVPASAASRADVRAIQAMLNDLGYQAGAPDGLMGRKTRAAIRAYQGDEGLLQDGRPSRELRGHLERTRRSQTGSSAGSASAATSSSSGKSSAAELSRLLKERRKRPESAHTGSQSSSSGSQASAGSSETKKELPRSKKEKQQKTAAAPATRASKSKSTSAKSASQRRRSGADRPTRGAAIALRRDTLRKVPNRRIVGHLQFKKGTQFDILKRRGLWLELRTQDPQKVVGWARLGSVKLTDPGRVRTTAASIAPRKKVRGGVLSNALGGWLGSNSSSTRSSTATIGIRGLTLGQLNAVGREDRQAMAKLDRMANPAAANDFARRAGLQARNVPYPPPQDYGVAN